MWRPAQEPHTLQIQGLNDKQFPIVDSIIRFGKYDWRVLDVQGDKALILSDRIIETRKYHEKLEPVTWELSSIRRYLNEEFYNAFNQDEQAKIVPLKIYNYENPWFATDSGGDTTDYIFLLSVDGVVKYFGDSRQLRSRNANTKYFIDDHFNGARRAVDTDGNAISWWLRTAGNNTNFAVNVTKDGRVAVGGDFVNRNLAPGGGVRPALWLKL